MDDASKTPSKSAMGSKIESLLLGPIRGGVRPGVNNRYSS